MKMTMRKNYELLNKTTRQEAMQHNVKDVAEVEFTAVWQIGDQGIKKLTDEAAINLLWILCQSHEQGDTCTINSAPGGPVTWC